MTKFLAFQYWYLTYQILVAVNLVVSKVGKRDEAVRTNTLDYPVHYRASIRSIRSLYLALDVGVVVDHRLHSIRYQNLWNLHEKKRM